MYNLPNNIKKKIYKRSYYMITREVRKQVLKSMANKSYTSTTFLEKTSDMCFKQSTRLYMLLKNKRIRILGFITYHVGLRASINYVSKC